MEMGSCGVSMGFSSVRKRCHLDGLAVASVEDAVDERELRWLFSVCAGALAKTLAYAAYVVAIASVVFVVVVFGVLEVCIGMIN